ncbi:response regulator [Sagittula sp. NFXS13]|uniref:response regulator n=1 Tax=Sagittula sp. NFXS13 TaxID=2819095 RepID=UPI0032DE3F22
MKHCDILILEDEAIIAMDIETTLEAAGHDNIAVCSTVDEAMAQIEKSTPKLALLDFNLGNGGTSVPVAERLSKCSVPFIFLSGYTESTVAIPEDISAAARLAKPFQSAELITRVQSVLNGS